MPNARSDSGLIERYRRYEAGRSVPSTYSRPASIDAWRARYVRLMLSGFIAAAPGTRWLTVGDGYYGHDAHFLRSLGVDVVASSLSGEMLREAATRGWIDQWRVENAEAIDQPEGAFDYVLCMETLQHCAKPHDALSEVMRVGRRGVVIMNCLQRQGRLLDRIREWARHRRGTEVIEGVEQYAPVGGPLFRFGIDDVAALAARAGMASMAVRAFNLVPSGRHWDRSASWRSPPFIAIRAAMAVSDAASATGLLSPSFAWFILLKQAPEAATVRALQAGGFTLRALRS
jgi:ubiquinone/menaquinone biosynthesis C-methylase UbiE